MTLYARLDGSVVVELFTPPAGYAITDCIIPAVAASFVTVPAGVAPEPGWTFDGTTFAAPVAPTPPTPTAAAVLAEKLAAGIAITSTATPAISSTYALDPVTMTNIGSVARDFAAGLGLPGSVDTFTYPDIHSVPVTFTGPQIVSLYKAQRDLMLILETQGAMMAMGATPTWPAQTATVP